MLQTFHRLYRDLAAGPLPSQHPLARAALECMHVGVVLGREAHRDRLHVRAAMLAYWTAVAIVPILLLGFSLIGPLGLGDSTSLAVRNLLYDTVLAESVEDVGDALDTLLASASLRTVGILGLVGILTIGVQLYFNAEQAYNDIFQSKVRRSFLLRVTLFYAGITLGPTLIAAGFVATATLPTEGDLFRRVVPVLLTAAALVAAIRLLPCREVSWRASLTGGLFSAVAFEGAKEGFGAYTAFMGTRDSLAGIYGSLAFMPAFLLWLLVLWFVVLLGVEIAWLVEHYETLIGAQRREVNDPHAAQRLADSVFSLSILGLVARRFLDGRGPSTVDELVALSGADPRHVQRAVDVWTEAGLLAESGEQGVLPTRPLHEASAAELLLAWRATVAPPLPEDSACLDTVAWVRARLGPALGEPGAWIPSPAPVLHRIGPEGVIEGDR